MKSVKRSRKVSLGRRGKMEARGVLREGVTKKIGAREHGER